MSTTDDGITRRQGTFDTDPISLRKEGANIQLPVIEGDKEIKDFVAKGDREGLNTEGQIHAIGEVRIKNRTHVIDTKADINLGVKAISEKAKAHQKQERNKIQSEKKVSTIKEVETVKDSDQSYKDRVNLTEKNGAVGIAVKAISEKAKAQQREQKDNSESSKKIVITKTSDKQPTKDNKKKGAESAVKTNGQTGDYLKSINEKVKSHEQKGQKYDKENVSGKKTSPVTVANKDSAQYKVRTEDKKDIGLLKPDNKGHQKEHNIVIEPNKKSSDKTSKQKLDDIPKSSKNISKAHPNKATDIKLTNVSPTERKGGINSEKVDKQSKIQNHINTQNVKTDSNPFKESINIVGAKEKKPEGSSKYNVQKNNDNKNVTDKSKAKSGVSIIKDSHSASGTNVSKGASPKPGEGTSHNKDNVSTLTVGSAPRVTTLGGAQQNKDSKGSDHNYPKEAVPTEQKFDSVSIVKSHEGQTEPDGNVHDSGRYSTKATSPKAPLDLNLTKDILNKRTKEPLIAEKLINMDNQAGIRRGESYETLYAERNTLLNAEIAYKRRIKQLEDEANDFLKHINQLTSENTRLHSRLEQLEGKLENIENSSEAKTTTEYDSKDSVSANNTKGDVGESDNQISKLKAQVIKLQSENQTSNEEVLKLKAELLSASRKLHALEKEKNSLADSVTAVESEKLDEIDDLQKDHSKIKKENKAQKNKIEELEKKVNALEFENNTLSESLSQKKTELEELLVVMKDENKFDNEIKDLKARSMRLEREKRELELKHNSEKRKLEEELEDIKSKDEKVNSELRESKTKSNDLTSKNKQLSSENKTLSTTCDSQKKEIEQLKGEIERLKSELLNVQKKLNSLKTDTENATTNLKDANLKLQDTNKELQSVVSDKEEQIKKLISQVDTLRAEKETEKQDFEHEKEKLTTEIDRLKIFEKHVNAMERELKLFVEKLEESEKQKAQLASQLEDKDYRISALEKQIFEMNLKIETLTKRVGQLDREKRDIENDKKEWEVKRDKINDIESSNKRLMEENKRLRGSLEDKHFLNPNNTGVKEKPHRGREAWIEDPIPIASLQKAVYVENKNGKKKVQIAPEPVVQKRRMPFTKSSPVKGTKPPLSKKEALVSLSPSRSLDDVRKSPASPVDSNPSLPELQREGRLTYGYSYTQGYSQIHRNRIRAAHKRVY